MAARVLVVGREVGATGPLPGARPGRILRREGFRAEPAGDEDALAELRRQPPDLVVLDLGAPDADGLELCRRLRAAAPGVPILITSAADGAAARVAGLDAGADDYLMTPFAPAELVARARALLRRVRVREQGAQLVVGELALDADGRAARRAGRPLGLTPREADLLAAFMESPERVLSREELLEAAWGEAAGVEPNIVDVYVGYLRRKLEQDGAPRVIVTVRGVGYVLRAG